IVIGVSGNPRLVRVTQYGIKEHGNIFGFDQNTCVPEVPPPNAVPRIWTVQRRRLLGEKRTAKRLLVVGRPKQVPDVTPGLRTIFQLEELIDGIAFKRNVPLIASCVLQAGSTQDEWAVIAVREGEHQALRSRVIELTFVKKWLDQPVGGIIIEIVN